MNEVVFPAPTTDRSERGSVWKAAALLAVIFFVYGLICYPPPSVGEPYYLGKAKNYWDPTWCPNDLFFESANTHLVFYVLFGWLTRFASLTVVSLVLRFAAMLLLASGWMRLGRSLGYSISQTLMWASLFLILQLAPTFAGEWLIGGAESKLFSYGCLLHCGASFLSGRVYLGAVFLGAAISMHPVVGLWGAIAIGAASLFTRQRTTSIWDVPPIFIPMLLVALPGLMPAFAVLSAGGLSPESKMIADYIQVFHRLRHHLDPVSLLMPGWVTYGILLGLIAALWPISKAAVSPVMRFFVWTMVIAAAGLAIGYAVHPKDYNAYAAMFAEHPTLMKLAMTCLKVYPFRVFDLAVPMTLALLAMDLASRRMSQRMLNRVLPVGIAGLLIAASLIPMDSKNPSFLKPEKSQNWVKTCHWISENLPEDDVFIMPFVDWAFHWHASRSQYVSYKNMPQDAGRLIEWNRRLTLATQWREKAFADKVVTREELAELEKQTQAEFLISDHAVSFEGEVVYREGEYQVVSLAGAQGSE